MDDNGLEKNKKKFNFKEKKDCTIHSIKEVEFFLCNFNKAIKSFKVFKFLKWLIISNKYIIKH